MLILRTKNYAPPVRDMGTPLALLLILCAVCPAQKEARLHLSPPALHAVPMIGAGPLLGRLFSPIGASNLGTPGISLKQLSQAQSDLQSGPQPPCRKEPIPPYPDLDGALVVKSWSESDFGRDWKPP